MISFFYESVDVVLDEKHVSSWIGKVIMSENKKLGDLNFIFSNDEYLLSLNKKFLNHDTYTDIISFDNGLGNELHGDIFISVDRVRENSVLFDVEEDDELRRVIIHGILHFCGYKDKEEEDKILMRAKENEKLALFHVEQR